MKQDFSNRGRANSIETFITDEIRKLDVNLRKAWSSFDELAIHDFRVSLKKLRAVIGFIKKYGLSKQDSRNLLKILKPVFRSGGRLRDLQVNHQLIRNYEKNLDENFISFRAFISREILFEEEDFKNISKDTIQLLDELDRAALFPVVRDEEDEIQNSLKIFLGKTFRKASKILRSDISENLKYHRIRKALKKVRFVFEMNIEQGRNTMDDNAHLSSLKNLESILGIWHDSISLKAELKAYLDGNKGTAVNGPKAYQTLLWKIDSDIQEQLLGFDDLFMKEYHWFTQFAYRLD